MLSLFHVWLSCLGSSVILDWSRDELFCLSTDPFSFFPEEEDTMRTPWLGNMGWLVSERFSCGLFCLS